MIFSSCSKDPALSLALPKKGFTVVQHLPATQAEPRANSLYLPARAIKKKEFGTKALNVLVDSMYAIMIKKNGVGIAANQLGKRLQIFIIEAQADNPRYKVLGAVKKQVFFNPTITKVSKDCVNFWHGCLSAQGEKRGNVATYKWLEYTCLNQQGQVIKGRLEGFEAVIFQHEFRHLLGGTYLDYAQHFLDTDSLTQKIEAKQVPFFETASDTLPLLLGNYEIGETLEDYYQKTAL